jgi:hypothetical protein
MNKERYELTSKTKKRLMILGLAGFILVLAGIALIKLTGHHGETAESEGAAFNWTQRLFTGLWINNVFFIGIALTGVFFFAIQYAAQAGWSAVIIRIPLSLGNWLPYAFGLLIVIFFAANFTSDWHLFHWLESSLYDKLSPEYDEVIAGKQPFLNLPFYLIRMITFFTLWIFLFLSMKKLNFEEDAKGGVENWKKLITFSAIFIIIYALSSSVSAWDWVMSIDTHWYSTIFGWYVFASWFPSALAVITLMVIYLREAGYLPMVNENHIHDLGKFIFAFSIFWTYIWFSQFMLIYYANIPEESVYFVERLKSDQYTPVFFLNLVLNFFFPFLVLMTRDAKRHGVFLKIVCVVILIGHWLDFYLMITPGTLHEHGGFGLIEIGTILIYASAFVFVVLTGLSKSALVPQKHPLLEESLHHHI